jgi:diguanylate cyclase (GGDEF)-like protein
MNLGGQFQPKSQLEIISEDYLSRSVDLQLWIGKTVKSAVLPGGVLLLGVAAAVHSGWLVLAPPALSFLYYCTFLAGVLLAWRFHSSRTVLAVLVLFLADQTIALSGAEHFLPGTAGWIAIQAIAVLVPVDMVLIALMPERGFVLTSVAPMGMLLFVQVVIVTVLCRAAEGSQVIGLRAHHPTTMSLPAYAALSFLAGGICLLGRWAFTRKPLDCALAWSLAAFWLYLRFLGTPRISGVYSSTAACILAVSIVENSYLLAYHDELTTLPSRRGLNDALMRLQAPYSIAVVDIDHFKRFNDTYGHDTGDQVLRLVASKLSHVTGGGQAYRCGGEEFTILFPGKTLDDVVDHLETLRERIESSEFRRRGEDRRMVPRGPDRRNERTRGRGRKGHAIRQLAQESITERLSVTVSIGAAESTGETTDSAEVVEAADKALYRAKDNGRNRVETFSGKRRGKSKAAGIA